MTATDPDVVRLARQLLERDLAEAAGTAARIEDDSPSDALAKAGMYAGLIAADLATVAGGPLTELQAANLGDVLRSLAGLLRVLDMAHAERTEAPA